jgi:hypothetical protein
MAPEGYCQHGPEQGAAYHEVLGEPAHPKWRVLTKPPREPQTYETRTTPRFQEVCGAPAWVLAVSTQEGFGGKEEERQKTRYRRTAKTTYPPGADKTDKTPPALPDPPRARRLRHAAWGSAARRL